MNIVHYLNMIQNKVASPRIHRKRQQRLQEIQTTALELVLEEGLDGLTMQKLATKLDYAVGALYRYFKSKDALLAALQRQVLQDFTAVFQAATQFCQQELAPETPAVRDLSQLYLAADIYAQLRQQSPTRFHLLHEMIMNPQNLLSLQDGLLMMPVALPLLRHIQGLFEQASQSQALSMGFGSGAAQERSLLFWSSLQGLLPLRKLLRYVPGYDFERLYAELLETLFTAWGAESELRQAARQNLKKLKQTEHYAHIYASLEEVSPSCRI